eukprot:3625910-Pyramimonas_sp.AAC.1
MTVSFNGCRDHQFPVERGVKQGCPLSGVIFALCFDPILRSMIEALPVPGVLRAFADDVGLTSANMYECLPPVLRLWVSAAGAAGLVLNLTKTELCFLFPQSDIAGEFRRKGVRTRSIKIRSKVLYLGVWMGPGAHEVVWEKPIAKCRARGLLIRALRKSLVGSILAYNTYGITVLSYVMQFYPPSSTALKKERDVVQLLTASP